MRLLEQIVKQKLMKRLWRPSTGSLIKLQTIFLTGVNYVRNGIWIFFWLIIKKYSEDLKSGVGYRSWGSLVWIDTLTAIANWSAAIVNVRAIFTHYRRSGKCLSEIGRLVDERNDSVARRGHALVPLSLRRTSTFSRPLSKYRKIYYVSSIRFQMIYYHWKNSYLQRNSKIIKA